MRPRSYVATAIACVLASCTAILDFSEPIGPEPGALPELLEARNDITLAFDDPAACAACHQRHYQEWQMTPHAYAVKDPVFQAMVRLGQRTTEGKLGQSCVRCHTPAGMATEQTTVSLVDEIYVQQLSLDTVAMGGVSCTTCHSVSNIIENSNGKLVYTPDGTMRGPIGDPVKNEFHASVYSPLLDRDTAGFGGICASCHTLSNELGAQLDTTYQEFENSEAKSNGEDCVTCHMPVYMGKAAVGPDAPAAELLPERTLHAHTFVGADVSLLPVGEFPGDLEMRSLSAALLKESAEFSAAYDANSGRILTTIKNLAGHGLPSGSTANRQMWIELIVRNSQGAAVFRSGTLDPDGNLRVGLTERTTAEGTDTQLAYFGKLLIAIEGFDVMSPEERVVARAQIEADCLPFGQGALVDGSLGSVVDMPWQAHWQCRNVIAPDATDFHSYDLGDLAADSYTARVRLRYRAFSPHFLTLLETEAGLDPAVNDRVPTIEIDLADLNFVIP